MVLCQIESNRTGRDSWRQSIESLPKKLTSKNKSLARKHSPRQARYVWVVGSTPIPLKLAGIKRKQALVSAFFIAGAGLEPATFGL